jgi:hypothetical protein
MFAANNAGTGNAFDTRFGGNVFFGAVSFDYLYVDVRGVLGGNWRFGRMPYTLGITNPAGGAMVFDPANSTGSGSAGVYSPFVSTSGVVDGVRGNWDVGPINLEVALFQESAGAYCVGVGAGCFPPDRQYQIVRATTGALLPGWTLGGSYYRQGAAPYAVPGSFFGGTAWGVDLSGTLFPGLRVYLDYASWQFRLEPGATFTAPAVSAWRVGGNLNLAQVAGITTWNPNLDFEYHNYGGPPAGALAWAPPRYSYATTLFGQAFDWNMRGWWVRLNLTFSPRWSGFISYEGGNVISTGASYYEWWLRLTHALAPRTNVYVQYTRGNNSATGDYFNFYRAELSTSW